MVTKWLKGASEQPPRPHHALECTYQSDPFRKAQVERHPGAFGFLEIVKQIGCQWDMRLTVPACSLLMGGGGVVLAGMEMERPGIRDTESPRHALQEGLQETGKILLGSGYLEVHRANTYGGRDGIGPTRQLGGRILSAWEMERCTRHSSCPQEASLVKRALREKSASQVKVGRKEGHTSTGI